MDRYVTDVKETSELIKSLFMCVLDALSLYGNETLKMYLIPMSLIEGMLSEHFEKLNASLDTLNTILSGGYEIE